MPSSPRHPLPCPHFLPPLELCSGGELFDRIIQAGHYDEAAAAALIAKLAVALHKMHTAGIVHRDLKPENILYATAAKDAEPIIADFGLATHLVIAVWGLEAATAVPDSCMEQTLHPMHHWQCWSGERDVPRTDDPPPTPQMSPDEGLVGTPGYLSPEIIRDHQYSPAADVWALGVILYILLCGCVERELRACLPVEGRGNSNRTTRSCVGRRLAHLQGPHALPLHPFMIHLWLLMKGIACKLVRVTPPTPHPPRPLSLPRARYPPFHATDNRALYAAISSGQFFFHDEAWRTVSASAKDLVRRMLTVSTSTRITVPGEKPWWGASLFVCALPTHPAAHPAQLLFALSYSHAPLLHAELLVHPWVASAAKEHMHLTLANLKKFNARRKIKAAAMGVAWLTGLVRVLQAQSGSDGGKGEEGGLCACPARSETHSPGRMRERRHPYLYFHSSAWTPRRQRHPSCPGWMTPPTPSFRVH